MDSSRSGYAYFGLQLIRCVLHDDALSALKQTGISSPFAGDRRFVYRCLCGLWCLVAAVFFKKDTVETDIESAINKIQPWFPHINLSKFYLVDVVRIPMQVIWLMIFQNSLDAGPRADKSQDNAKKLTQSTKPLRMLWWTKFWRLNKRKIDGFLYPEHFTDDRLDATDSALNRFSAVFKKAFYRVRWVFYGFACTLAWFCITTPFTFVEQCIFSALLCMVALWVRGFSGRAPNLLLITLSLVATSRYLWWRCSATLNWDDILGLTLGVGLLCAEAYAVLIMCLGYFQTMWPLGRTVAPLPKDSSLWPSVDVYIPTYNEPLAVVKPTVFAALGIDWPEDRINIYLLDDGRRDSFEFFASSVGVHYITRTTNEHAKAGNLNNALTKTQGEFVAIFDCDHIPTRSFLQVTMGWFLKDSNVALIQTPHHFFSPDPFERNLGNFRDSPNENELFYGLCQDGNDLWGAAFFCGSCAVLRREPLLEIGGIATETVTEDAHTALKLHRQGYGSVYLNIPQAAGLATESLSAHIGQRIRWARGMTQIFRLDNPLLGKGLSIAQRLCYANAMLHFLHALPRIVFLTAPLAFLVFQAYIIHAPAFTIAIYVLPHLVHSSVANSRMQGPYRRSYWAEMYETVLAWYILKPTLMALISPHKGQFNVTEKGGLVTKKHFDWAISKPYLVLVILNLSGLLFGAFRLLTGPTAEIDTLVLNLIWTTYNVLILGGAIAVSEEAKQIRQTHRVAFDLPGSLCSSTGKIVPCTIKDYSNGGFGVQYPEQLGFALGDEVSISLSLGRREFSFPATIINLTKGRLGVKFEGLTETQERDLIQCTFARADAWVNWNSGRSVDRPLSSLGEVIVIGFRGYKRLIQSVAPILMPMILKIEWFLEGVKWLLPRQPSIRSE